MYITRPNHLILIKKIRLTSDIEEYNMTIWTRNGRTQMEQTLCQTCKFSTILTDSVASIPTDVNFIISAISELQKTVL